ncbi:NuoM family protein [Methylococcus sp. EFPC2]|uniref:complex I subunit 4 family protein n=1 Tax=Methylococcus sp. EFPC2 TaxID=2812648 RepID=UPI0019684DAB|nr:NADH-quinone oxidoreductase subunit M [Methylococcus sp. EFPC2]QSA98279.1 NADH-quinone oxidoreductase subunit M [Methylococcus sp. EFPC2]
MHTSHLPVLSLLIFLPIAAGAGLLALRDQKLARTAALAAAAVELLLSILACGLFDADLTGMQLIERQTWIPTLHIDYFLGVDGVSLPFLPLNALLTVGVIAASWTGTQQRSRAYFALLLVLEGITQGIYCSLDLGLFFMFWELTLVPLFFLISLWGVGPRRRHAATQYVLFMLAGGVPLLVAFILLALNNASEAGSPARLGLSFDYLNLLQTPIPLEQQTVIFLLLLLGFGIKAPFFPFHVWLPNVALEGPVGVSALLMGLKLGLFGILRYAVPLAPQAANHCRGLLIALGVAGALYGALLALRQSNLRRLLAYSGVSHVGFVMIGVAALNLQGLQGAVFQLVNFGIVSSGLMLIAGFLQRRLGSTDLASLGGIARPMPRLAALFFVLGLASLGVPGTNGFAAEHLILIGAFRSQTGLGLAGLLAVILGAAYFLDYYRRAFLGPVVRPGVANAADLLPRELWLAGTLAVMSLLLGLFPLGLLRLSEQPLTTLVARLETGTPITLADAIQDRGHPTLKP